MAMPFTQFRLLGIIKPVHSREITGDPTDSPDMGRTARWAFLLNDAPVVTTETFVNGKVYSGVTHVTGGHMTNQQFISLQII